MSANTYTRLVGYDEALKLRPDLVERVDASEARVFTFVLREGHRWSDGQPFTSEDFRYFWEDVALNKELSPAGAPEFMLVDGKRPQVEVIDARTIRYSWDKPNPRFLPTLAQPRDPFIYRPAHYLKRFHAKYADKAALEEAAKAQKLKSWAALHNRLDDMNEQTNPDLPTLQAWRVTNAAPASRFIFERNPFYHRVDGSGQQLPYVDRIVLDVAAGGLMAAKANAGETDLLVRGLTMADIPILKEGERAKGYRTLLWPIGARQRDRPLSEPQHHRPGLARAEPGCALPPRPVARHRPQDAQQRPAVRPRRRGQQHRHEREPACSAPDLRTAHASYDPAAASRLLDEIGLTKRNGAGTRLLPDGRELEIIVETDGEGGLVVDGLTLIAEFWREIGVRLFVKPQDRTVLRNRAYSGLTVMVAAQGLDNALPTALMPPTELAPMSQDVLLLAEMGPVRRNEGQERRTLRHARGAGALSTSTGNGWRPAMPRRRRASGARCCTTMPTTNGASARSPARCSRSSSRPACATCRHGRSIAGSRPPCSASTAWTSSTGSARWAGRRRRDDQVPVPGACSPWP